MSSQEELFHEVYKLFMKDVRKAALGTAKQMTDELNEMYQTFIDQFYKYKTTSYIRHWEGYPGTGHGQNLYFGNDISRDGGVIDVSFSGTKMDGGYPYSIDRDNPDAVLEMVMSGVRFPFKRKKLSKIESINKRKKLRKYNHRYGINWTGEYHGDYFEYKGIMQKAFDTYEKKAGDIAGEIFITEWVKLGW